MSRALPFPINSKPETVSDKEDLAGACVDVIAIMLAKGADLGDEENFVRYARSYCKHFYHDDKGESLNRTNVGYRELLYFFFDSNKEDFDGVEKAANKVVYDQEDNMLRMLNVA